MSEARPDPDQLLAEVKQQEARKTRGRLKVFFGMAAGVGKTYAMLEEARARASEGLNVLIGYAEPHIRTETEALLLGLEILPYKLVEYKNTTLKEFDLDTAIARRPALVCVDELAHTNAPGLRHPKRWQDVVELLDAGINVYTTLNVQHLESVNDVVERVTGVRVRETLPDSVLEQADEVELVDIAPEELLERFREGKIYRPEQAERAARHFFTKGNLIALRELALRTTAQRVDAQMLEARREAGVQSTWEASERVLVCISPSPMSRRLVRSAKRLASRLRADWIAAYVETPRSVRLPQQDRRRVEGTLRLADELGAKTLTLSGQNVADELIQYARKHNVTKIVIGKPQSSKWRDLIMGSVVDDLIRRSGDTDIYVIRGSAEEAEVAPTEKVKARRDYVGYATAAAITGLATLIGWPLFHRLKVENENILMLYLLGILWVATHFGRGAAILASVLSVAAFDLIFVPPYYTFAISDRQYLVTFLVMLSTALVISTLTLRVRAQAEMARERERRTAALHGLSRDLAAARTTDEIAAKGVHHIRDIFETRCVLLTGDPDQRLTVKGDSDTPASVIDPKELGVAQWALDHDQIAGRGTNTLPAAEGTYVPLRASRGVVGVLGLLGDKISAWTPDRRQLAEAFASQTALAVERTMLADEARAAWERVEAEFLRNTLLSGVSHELRTPLAGITGAASAMLDAGSNLSESARQELLDTVVTESERMERLINNLLDMTRMESGGLVLKKEWVPLEEIIGSSMQSLSRRLAGRDIRIHVPENLPLVSVDPVAIEQVVSNLLDNAAEYTPAGGPIEISARADEREVTVEVADHGPGIPVGLEKRLFDKFFRIAKSDGRRGIGLGLAIARGIIELHGGRIRAVNRTGGGSVFTFTLPRDKNPPLIEKEHQQYN